MPSGVRALGGRLLLARRGVLGCIERDPGERPTFLGDGGNPFAIFIPHVLKRWLQGSLLDAEAQSATTEWSQDRASGSLARSAGPSGEPRKIKVPLPAGLFAPTASDPAQPITSPRFADTGITRVKSRTSISRGQT